MTTKKIPTLMRLPVRGAMTTDEELTLYQCKALTRPNAYDGTTRRTCEKLAAYTLNGTSLCDLHAAQFALKWMCEASEGEKP